MRQHKYHIVGAAGVGMNPLAQLLLAAGCRVSGSDRFLDQGASPPALDILRRQGLTAYPQDGTGVTTDLDAVVVSTAIEDDNPDIAAARRQNIPVRHRTAILAALAERHRVVGVTGTAGKTTVTGMIGWTLEQLGTDPTVVNGGALVNWRALNRIGNFRQGQSDVWVLELDESDRSLLRFHPDHAVITNISKDHFELDEVRALFDRFAGQVKRGVIAPGCHDSGTAITNITPSPRGVSFEYKGIVFRLRVPGRHNVENAHNCIMLCERLGCDPRAISSALAEFQGIERRLEYIGQAHDVDIFDDYAHNPAKITAAWETLAPWHKRVVAVWRPHGYGPLHLMWDEWIATFTRLAGADCPLFLLPVFFAGGTADRRRGAAELATALRGTGVDARDVADYQMLSAGLLQTLRPSDALLILGARDPELPRFARNFITEFRDFIAHRMSGTG